MTLTHPNGDKPREKMAKKRTETEEPVGYDPFLDDAPKWSNWLENNIKLMAAVVLTVLVAAIGLEYAKGQSSRSGSETLEALDESIEQYAEATDPRTTITTTSSEAKRERLEGAEKKFIEFEKRFSEGPSVSLSKLYRADLRRRLGDHSGARTLYDAYLASEQTGLRFLALEGAGYAAEALGEFDKALGYFEKLSKAKEFEDYALKHIARVHEAQGRPDQAKKALEAIVSKEPSSSLKFFAEGRLKRLP